MNLRAGRALADWRPALERRRAREDAGRTDFIELQSSGDSCLRSSSHALGVPSRVALEPHLRLFRAEMLARNAAFTLPAQRGSRAFDSLFRHPRELAMSSPPRSNCGIST